MNEISPAIAFSIRIGSILGNASAKRSLYSLIISLAALRAIFFSSGSIGLPSGLPEVPTGKVPSGFLIIPETSCSLIYLIVQYYLYINKYITYGRLFLSFQ